MLVDGPVRRSAYVAWRAGATTLCHAIDNFIPPVRDYELGLRSVFKSLETTSLLTSFSPISFMIQFKGFLLSKYVIYTRNVYSYLSPVIPLKINTHVKRGNDGTKAAV